MRTFNNENAAEVDISEGKNPIVLQDFQEAAMKKMGEYDSKGVFNGLLVLPTGAGKKVAAVATSGGSGIGKTADKLKQYVEGAVSVDAKLVHSDMEVKNFAESL